uniref:Uncharacterized protein n=1 Tax=Arundo donax TaxID=35708 RepID=A0A0A9B746_ARUDO
MPSFSPLDLHFSAKYSALVLFLVLLNRRDERRFSCFSIRTGEDSIEQLTTLSSVARDRERIAHVSCRDHQQDACTAINL